MSQVINVSSSVEKIKALCWAICYTLFIVVTTNSMLALALATDTYSFTFMLRWSALATLPLGGCDLVGVWLLATTAPLGATLAH